MNTSDAVITVRGMCRSYGGRAVLHGVDLDLARGEVLALLGPNGAGKTTTVEILEGFRQPDAGEVQVLGALPWQAGRAWRERTGIVLQEHLGTGGTAALRIDELLRATAACYPDPWHVDELLAAVGLLDRQRARIGTLSGGQRRRLDVALGVVGRPELLFLDEPTTGLDPEARRTLWELIATLAAQGTAILLTSHYLDEAEQLADRVAVLVSGRIAALGSPPELRARHAGVPRVCWREGGVTRELRTLQPTAAVRALAERLGGEIPELAIVRPSLEEAYLALIRDVSNTVDGAAPRMAGASR